MTGPDPCAITSMCTSPRSTMKRCSKFRFILTCEEAFDVDCVPEVCARETGQTTEASKPIIARARFMWPVLNERVRILHPPNRAGKLKECSCQRDARLVLAASSRRQRLFGSTWAGGLAAAHSGNERSGKLLKYRPPLTIVQSITYVNTTEVCGSVIHISTVPVFHTTGPAQTLWSRIELTPKI